MRENLPKFRYHPNPIKTGAVRESDKKCICCGKVRGYIYVGPVYATDDLDESLCPWCIYDGTAAKVMDASFADDYPLNRVGISADIVEEVHRRTPSYVSWQQEHWLSHCNDACEFHGDASEDDVKAASAETKRLWLEEHKQDEKEWMCATNGYRPSGDSALYKFVCRHCGVVLFGRDLS